MAGGCVVDSTRLADGCVVDSARLAGGGVATAGGSASQDGGGGRHDQHHDAHSYLCVIGVFTSQVIPPAMASKYTKYT